MIIIITSFTQKYFSVTKTNIDVSYNYHCLSCSL